MAGTGDPREPGSELWARLDNALPATIPAGRGTALFLYGHLFARTEPVAAVELRVDGVAHRPVAARMPRPDVHAWLAGTPADPHGLSLRSGFWGTVAVGAQAPGAVTVSVRVRLAGGRVLSAPLGEIAVTPAPAARPEARGGRIAVCLATFEPDPNLLNVQLATLRGQTDRDWTCLISDGGSRPQTLAAIEALVAGDGRFSVTHAPGRLDPYRNFERALGLVPSDAPLVALCDQDDRWYPEKLATLRAALGGHMLVYSDLRLVDPSGQVLRDSLWPGRRREHENLASLLVANAVPGAAMLMRRELLDLALPFPEAPGVKYHDHWLALAARAGGTIGYVPNPLYDYVQHEAAVQGQVAARGAGARAPLRPGGRLRGAYFGGYVTREVYAQTLLARARADLDPRRVRSLAWFAAADRAVLPLLWLALRPLRRLVGRDETLGGELALVRGLLWRRAVAAATGRLPGWRRLATSVPDPPVFEQRRLRRWRAAA